MATAAGMGGSDAPPVDPGHAEVVQRILAASSHYEVLSSGIHHRSTDDEIKRAYRTLALKTHPDKNKHDRAEEAFKRVHNAFLTLETQEKRDAYHRSGGRGLRPPGEDDDEGMGGFGGFHGGFGHRAHDPFDFFNIFMGAAGGRRGGGGIDEIMMMMMLQQMLGGGRGGFGGGGFGGFGGVHFHGGGGFGFDEYDEEDEYYEEEEEEEEDPELVGVFYDQRRGVFFCEGCDVVLKSQAALSRHIATEEHQHRFTYDEDDDDDDEEDEDEDEDEDEGDEPPDLHYDQDDAADNSDEDYDIDVVDGLVFNTRDEAYVCRPCGVSLKRKAEMITHVNGKRHKTEMEKEEFHCEVCDVTTKTKDEKQRHLQGKKHLRQLRSPATAMKGNSSGSAPAQATAKTAPRAAPKPNRGKGRRN